jgi:hypothetical protein
MTPDPSTSVSPIESRHLAVHALVLMAMGGLMFAAGNCAFVFHPAVAPAMLAIGGGMLAVASTVFGGSLRSEFAVARIALWLAASIQFAAAVVFGMLSLEWIAPHAIGSQLALRVPLFAIAAYLFAHVRLAKVEAKQPPAVLLTVLTGVVLAVAAGLTIGLVLQLSYLSSKTFVCYASAVAHLLLVGLPICLIFAARQLPLSETNSDKEAFWFNLLGGTRVATGLLLVALGIYLGIFKWPLNNPGDLFNAVRHYLLPAVATAIGLHWAITGSYNLAGKQISIPRSLGSGIGISLLVWMVICFANS